MNFVVIKNGSCHILFNLIKLIGVYRSPG